MINPLTRYPADGRAPPNSSVPDQIETRPPGRPGYRGRVLDGLGYDDSEPPSIGLVPPGTSWDEVHDHIKIAHNFLLVQPEPDGEYAGAYWTGSEMIVLDDLGADQDEALDEFRDELRQRGEL
jgi:hypothetical protein